MVTALEGYRVFAGDMVTGLITTDLPVSGQSWGMRLNDAGPLDVDIPALAAETLELELRAATAPLKQFLGIAYGNRILECGPIWKRAYDPKKGSLKVNGAGLWSILDTVKALPWVALANGVSPTKVSLDITKKTLGSIARELVRISIQTNPDNPGLPIVLPDVIAGTNERHYAGYTLPWLGDLLKKLTQVQRGPDIRFRPRFRGDDPRYVEWVMECGTEASPLLLQPGDDWLWDGTVEQSGVVGFGVTEDATGMAAMAYQPGAGQEQDMKLATAKDLSRIKGAGYPWTEVDEASKDVETQSILQDYADASISAAQYPVENWSVSVRADAAPTLGTYLPGEMARVVVPVSHPILDAGEVRTRMMAIDGDATNDVSITLAPLQGRL